VAQIRNPKPETRKKAEIRDPKAENAARGALAAFSSFGYRIYFGLRASGFGFQGYRVRSRRTRPSILAALL
jgi:hypothetical protein